MSYVFNVNTKKIKYLKNTYDPYKNIEMYSPYGKMLTRRFWNIFLLKKNTLDILRNRHFLFILCIIFIQRIKLF